MNKKAFTLTATALLIAVIVIGVLCTIIYMTTTGSLSKINSSNERGINENIQEKLDSTKEVNNNQTNSCGNNLCESNLGETGGPEGNCLIDCSCGNSVCDPGEKPQNCHKDCCNGGKGTTEDKLCGDGLCIGYACGEDNESSPYYCPKDCHPQCGNGICDKGEGPDESYAYPCPEDCKWQKCGDGICTAGDGGPEKCPQDCAAKCGDCICAGGENYITCPNDCGSCGDGFCSNCTSLNENTRTCNADCH